MFARLSVGFVFSVLLHGLVFWAFSPRMQPGGARYGQVASALSKRMSVQLVPASRNKQLSRLVAKPEKKAAAVPPPAAMQAQPAAPAAVPAGANGFPGFPGSPWSRPFVPGMQRQMQASYQQMYEAQARQRVLELARLEVLRLQADIGQSLNQSMQRAEGQCLWSEGETDDAGGYRCETKALAALMQADAEKLGALRKAMRIQGLVLEGFAVGSNGGRTEITYHVHPAGRASAP